MKGLRENEKRETSRRAENDQMKEKKHARKGKTDVYLYQQTKTGEDTRGAI